MWILPAAALAAGAVLLRRRHQTEKENMPPAAEPPTSGSAEPDLPDLPPLSRVPAAPEPFGRETVWLAVRCGEPERVMQAMNARRRLPADWHSGLAAAAASPMAFYVTQAMDGWVLVIGRTWPLEDDLERRKGFSEIQSFSTAGAFAWRRYRDGVCVRNYEWADGQVTESGALTPEELELDFDAFPRMGDTEVDWDNTPQPDEKDVLDIAAAWGLDPRFEARKFPPALGWVCV